MCVCVCVCPCVCVSVCLCVCVCAYAVRFTSTALWQTVEDVVESPYTLVVVNSKLSSKNTPSYQSLANVVKMLPRIYRKNIQRLFIVHPSLWLKSALLFLRSVVSRKFWNKVTHVESVQALAPFFDKGSLLFPEHVFRTDAAKVAAQRRAPRK